MRKIVDDKGRLFGFISPVDVIVVAVAALLVVAVLSRFKVRETPLGTTNTVDVTYTVKIFGIRDTNANLLHPGDKLFAADTESNLGTIRDVKVEDAYAVEPLDDGTYKKARVYDRYDVTLTIVAPCSYSNSRYYADRTFELNANAEIWMHTKYNELYGTVMTIAVE